MNRIVLLLILGCTTGFLGSAQQLPMIQTDSDLPDGRVGSPYALVLTARNGLPPYAWEISAGSLPSGLTLGRSSGLIGGVPSRAGTYQFDVRVTDASERTREKAFRITINPAEKLVIQTEDFPAATVGTPYTRSLSATGGSSPYTWAITSGSLPTGLALTGSTGVVSGTPATAGTFTFTARVTDSANETASKAFTITVNPAPVAPLTITTSTLSTGEVGQAFSQTLAASGGSTPYAWSISSGSLPPGLSLSASGTITGTPTAAGDYDFTARVTDAANRTATKALRISVNPAPLVVTTTSLPAGGVGQTYSATLVASGGVTPYNWSVQNGSLPGGLSLGASGAISGTPNAAGDFDFTVRVGDSANRSATKALRISVNPAALTITTTALASGTVGQSYAQSLAASGGTPPYAWSVAGGNLPGGMTLSTSGSISGTPNTAGDFDVSVRVTDSVNQSATKALRISVNAPATPLSVATAELPSGTAGQPYSQALSGNGGTPPYTWALNGGTLPPGLTLSSSGAITGTATTAGNYDFVVRLTDAANGSATKGLRITISPAATPPLTITTTALAPATTGQPYSQSLAASGGAAPYSWSITSGALPAGVTLAASGVLAGTSGAAGEFDFTVRVTDSAGNSATKSLRLSVVAALAPLTITTAALPSGATAVDYGQTLTASGGRPPYVWSVIGAQMPPGLALDAASGVISGVPASAGSFPVTIRVTDANARTADRVFTLVIASSLAVSTCPTGTGRTGVAYTGGLAATGGTAPYLWSVNSGQLPPGLGLNASTGALSGTPTVAGLYSFGVAVADAGGATATRSCSIRIDAALEILTDTLPDATTRASYSHTLRARGGTAPFVWSIVSGTLAPGLSLDPNTGTIAGQPGQAGRYSFEVQLADGTGRQVQRMLSLSVVTGLAIPLCPTAVTTIGGMYNSSLVAIGGVTPYTWAVENGSLPLGLTLTPDTGLISGRASEARQAEFSVRATDATGATAVRGCTISVAPEFRLITTTVGEAKMRVPYRAVFRAEGGMPPYIWTMTAGALPPGLTLDSAAGEVNGTPAVAGTFRFNLRATDASGLQVERAFELLVAAALTISACPTPVAVVDEVYSSGLSVTGGEQPVTWALESGVLPEGLMLSAEAGTVAGTPVAPGRSEFVIRATDAAADTATRTCSIAVSPAALRFAAPDYLDDALLGASYQAALGATGGRSPYVWSLADGRLPPGLSLDSNGILSGTPTEPGTYRFTMRVGDQDRAVATRIFELRVLPGEPPRISFAGLSEILGPAQQPRVQLSLENGYPTALRGVLTLRFRPDPGLVDDPSIRFATGGRTVSFEVAANSTDFVFPVPELAFQTGSVAGAIELFVQLFAADMEVMSSPAPVRTVRVDRTAPVISNVRVNRTPAGFEVVIVGISTTRDVTSATFQFMPAAGSRLDASQVTVPTEEAARRWFEDARSAEFGGQFSFVQPFSVQGATLSEVSITLTNGQGTSQPARARF